jgi:phosphoglycolate phosphatase-like HAD superfamily hydrolase
VSVPVWVARLSTAAVAPSGPNSVANLFYWLDAADLSTLSTSSSAMVAPTATDQTILRWVDKSKGHVFSRAYGSPRFQAAANGRSAVQFWNRANNNFDMMSGPSIPHPPVVASLPSGSAQGWTCIAVLKRTQTASNTGYGLWTYSGTDHRYFQVETNRVESHLATSATARAGINWGAAPNAQRALTVNAFDYLEVSHNFDTNVVTGAVGVSTVNKRTVTVAEFVWSTSAGFAVGGRYNPLGCDVAELLFYNRTLTAAELTTLKTYLTAKWGL